MFMCLLSSVHQWSIRHLLFIIYYIRVQIVYFWNKKVILNEKIVHCVKWSIAYVRCRIGNKVFGTWWKRSVMFWVSSQNLGGLKKEKLGQFWIWRFKKITFTASNQCVPVSEKHLLFAASPHLLSTSRGESFLGEIKIKMRAPQLCCN